MSWFNKNSSGEQISAVKMKQRELCIYRNAVNDQGAVVQRLHSEGADQWFSIPEPAEDWAGISVDRAVEHGGAALGDCLRHVGLTLQHWRLCRHTQHMFTRSVYL